MRRPRRLLLVSTALQAAGLVVLVVPARAQPAPNARPIGGQVVAGSASIARAPNLTTINQASQRAAINWRTFDVGSRQAVRFAQPSSSASTLNRVTTPNPSQIAGRITANGQVVIVNQSGVMFYKGAQVDVNGLVVSAAGITNKNYMAGRMIFDQPARPNARVVNEGTITINQAGLGALVAPEVANKGVIVAKLGHVVLAGAKTATLDMYGDGLLSIDVNGEVTQAPVGPNGQKATALVTNSGTILANGGKVLLTARAADGIVQNLVDAGGTIAADTAGGKTGMIALRGVGGDVVVSGALLARGEGAGAHGGSVVVNGDQGVRLASTARVDASGAAGGGVVAVGTTLRRAKRGPSVTAKMTAKAATIEAGATIRADATDAGNGGRVTVLSTEDTDFSGAIRARGGAGGGDGGFAEISGGGAYALNSGDVDLGAPKGAVGSLLLDPNDLDIVAGNVKSGVSIFPAGTITATASAASVGASRINNLGTSSNVTVQASGTIDIEVNVSVDRGLFIQAGSGIAVTPGVLITAGSVTSGPALELSTDHGALTLDGAGLQAPSISLRGDTINLGSAVVNAGTGSGLLSLTAAAGNISQAASGKLVAGTLTGSASGDVTLAGTSNAIAKMDSFAAQSLALTDTGTLEIKADLTTAQGLSIQSGTGLTVDSGKTVIAGKTLAGAELTLSTANGTVALNGATLQAPVITLNGDSINLGSAVVNAALQTNLTAAVGGVSQTANGKLIAPSLLGDIKGAAALMGSLNTIGALGSFSAASLSLNAGTGQLAIDGAVSVPGTIDITAGSLQESANGSIVGGGTLSATLSGGADLEGQNTIAAVDRIAASTLTLDDDSRLTISGLVTLTGTADVETKGTGGNALVLTGSVIANGASLNSADELDIPGLLNAGTGVASLSAPAGDIQETGGTLIATGLSANALGFADFSGATSGAITSNRVGTLLGFSGGDSFTLNDGTALTVAGNVVAGTSLVHTGLITLRSDAISLGASLIAYDGGTVLLAPDTTGGTLTLTGSAIPSSIETDGGTLALGDGSAGVININTFGAIATTTADTLLLETNGFTTGQVNEAGSLSVGTLAVNTGGTFGIGGAVSAGSVSLIANAVTEASTGSLGGNGTLSGSVANGLLLDKGGNTLAAIGSLFAGTLVLNDGTNALAVTGSVTARSIDLIANAVSETSTGGIIDDGALTGSITLGATLQGDNAIAALGSFGAGTLLLNDPGNALSITGAVNAGSIDLQGISVSEGTGGVLQGVTMLTGSLSAGATLDNTANSVTALGAFTVADGFELNDSAALAVAGDVISGSSTQAGRITLRSDTITLGGTLTGTLHAQDAGTVLLAPDTTGGTLTLTGSTIPSLIETDGGTLAVGDANTGSININTLGAVAPATADTLLLQTNSSGTAQVSETGSLQVGALLVNTGGVFSIGGAVSAGSVSLIANTVTEASTGSLVGGGTLSGSVTTGLLLDNGGNALDAIGSLSAGTLVLNDGTNALAITGSVNAGSIDLTANTVNETGGSIVGDGTLAGSITLGATLQGANAIAALGNFGAGTLLLNDPGHALSIAGTVNAGSIDLQGISVNEGTAGVLNVATLLSGSLSAGATLDNAGNSVAVLGTFTADTLALNAGTAPTLALTGAVKADSIDLIANSVSETSTGSLAGTGAAGTTLTGTIAAGATLDSSANNVATLGGFSTGTGTLVLADGAALTIAGPVGVTAGASITAAGISITGLLNAGASSLDLIAPSGSITENGGTVIAANLSGSVTAGDALFNGANQVGTLGAFTVSGNFALDDEAPLTVAGLVNAGTGDSITLHTDSLTLSGNLVASNGTVAIAPETAGAAMTVGSALGGAIDTGTLVLGTTLTGNIALNSLGPVPATLALYTDATGTVTETGILQTGTLIGTVGAALLNDGSNTIGTLGGFNAGTLILNDTADLTVAGAVTVPASGGSLSLTAPDITLTGLVQGQSLVGLFATTGSVIENSGRLVLPNGTLTGGAGAAGATLIGANTVLALGSFTVNGGTLSFHDDAAMLNIVGSVSATGINLTGIAAGESGSGELATGLLTGGFTGAADFGSPNAVATLGNFTAASLVLDDGANPLEITGTVSVNAGGISLTAASLFEATAGSLIGDGTLSGTIGGATLGNANMLAALGDFSAGTLVLNDGNSALGIVGTVDVPLIDITEAASLTETTGSIIGNGTLNARVTGAALLDNTNTIAALGSINAPGGLTFRNNGTALAIAGMVNTGTGDIALFANALTEAAGGTLITTGSLTGSVNAGPADFGNANTVALLGSFTAGSLLLNDGATALEITGAVSVNAGGISLTAASLSEATTGSLIGDGTLSGTIGSGNGGATLDSANTLAALGDFSAGTLSLNDIGNALSITGTVNTGSLDLIANLVTETTGLLIGGGTLSGTIGGGAGTAALGNANTLAALGDFSAGTLVLNDGSALAIVGTVNTGGLDLTAPSVTETTGVLIGDGTLSGTIGTATLGKLNTLAALGNFNGGTLVLNDGSALVIAGTVNTGSLDLTAPSVTETATGLLIGGGTLSGVIGAAAILDQTNTLGALGNFSAGTLVLNNASGLGIAGAVDAPVIDITAASLTETSGSFIGGGTLTAQLTGAALLNNTNQLSMLGNITAPDGFSLINGASLAVGGVVNGGSYVAINAGNNPLYLPFLRGGAEVTGASVTLSAGAMVLDGLVYGTSANGVVDLLAGSVTEQGTGTIVTPGTLVGGITGDAILDGPRNAIGTLGNFSAGGSITLDAIDNLSVAGPVTAGTLVAGAPIVVTDVGTLSVPGVMNAGSITLTADSIALTGALQGTTGIDLVTTAGNLIEEGVGTIALPTGTLTGSIAGSAALDGANTIGTLGSFAATVSIILKSAQSLDVVSTVSAGPSVLLDTGSNDLTVATGGLVNAGGVTLDGGNLLLYGAVTGAQAISLGAKGTISETGALDTALLTGSATATAAFTGINDVTTLGSFSVVAQGGLSALTFDDTRPLQITGPVNAGSIKMDAAAITLAGLLQGTTIVDLTTTAGGLAENATTGTIIAGTLVSTGSIAGGATLDGLNTIGVLGNFSAAGLSLNDLGSLHTVGTVDGRGAAVSIDASTDLITAGTISGGTVTLTAGGVAAIGGLVSSPTEVDISAGTVGVGGTVQGGDVDITGNAVGVSGLVSGNPVTISALNSGLAVTPGGVIRGGPVTLAAATLIDMEGLIQAGTVTLQGLTGTTSATEAGAGEMAATALTGSLGGGATLDGPNLLATLVAFTAGGLTLDDGMPLDVAGAVNAGTAATIDTGTATLHVLPGAALTAGGITLSAGSIALDGLVDGTNAAGAAVSLVTRSGGASEAATGAILTPGTLVGDIFAGATLTGTNTIATLGSFIAANALDLADTGSLAVAGPVSASTVTLQAGAIGLTGFVQGAGGVDLITTAGNLTESGAGEILLSAGTLTGNVAGLATLDGANTVAALGSFTAAGGLNFDNAAGLTIAGVVSGGPAIVFGVSGPLSIGAGGVIQAGSIDLNASSLSESATGAVIAPGQLSGSIAAAANLAGANTIAALGDFSANGLTLDNSSDLVVRGSVLGGPSATLTDAGSMTIPGLLSASNVVLTAGGSIAETGSLVAGTLSGSAGGAASFSGANQVATLADFTAPGGFLLVDQPDLQIASNVQGGPSVQVNDGGALSVSGALDGSTIALSAANIFINGSANAPAHLSLTAAGGSITVPGDLTTPLLTGRAATAADFTGSNSIAALGDFTASSLLLTDRTALNVTGGVTIAHAATLQTSGQLGITGALSADTAVLAAPGIALHGTLSAATRTTLTVGTGGVTETGLFLTGELDGTANGPVNLTAGNRIGAIGDFTAGPGAAGLFQLNNNGDITLNGTLTAGTIVANVVGGQFEMGNGSAIVTGGAPRPPGHTFTVPPTNPYTDGGAYLSDFVQKGTSWIYGIGGGPAILWITARAPGDISFDPAAGLHGPTTWLLLTLGQKSLPGAALGTALGEVFVQALNVQYFGVGGSADLFGTVNGVAGQNAASQAYISPAQDPRFRFNTCPVQSVNCVMLPPEGLPPINPLQNVSITTGSGENNDNTLLLPIVSDRDFPNLEQLEGNAAMLPIVSGRDFPATQEPCNRPPEAKPGGECERRP